MSDVDDLDWDSTCWSVIQSQSSEIEFDWFAQDLSGNLAALSSFGIGPSPIAVRASRDTFNTLQRRLADLPEITAALVDANAPPDPRDWERYARTGLFAYDNANVSSRDLSYRRIARPVSPLHISALGLPPELLLALPVLPVVFAESASIPFASIPP